MNQYYVVVVVDGIEPTLDGPYTDSAARDRAAIAARRDDEALDNGIFALDVEDGRVEMWAYGSSYLDSTHDTAPRRPTPL
jgi:hypothetical protein